MLLTTDALKDLLGTIALMALLSVAYGTIMRASAQVWRGRPVLATLLGQSVLGVLFGGAAILAMHDPIHLAEGVIGDLRSVPIAMAGAFLGPFGAAIAMVMAMAGRIEVGGAGMASGCVGIVILGLAGLAWAWWLKERQPGLVALLGLAALTASSVVSVVLLPPAAILPFLTSVWPFLLALQTLGIIVVGTVLERERRQFATEGQLILAAKRDPLTGLLNRRGLEAWIPRVSTPDQRAGLLMFDLDDFKQVNDVHGHAAGDAVLKEVGLRLRRGCRSNDLVSRLGGEEMVVFLPGLTARQAEDAGQRLCDLIRSQPFVLPSGTTLTVTTSVGGTWTAGPSDLATLLGQADGALYAAKAAGRDRCQFAEVGVEVPGQKDGRTPGAANDKLGALWPASWPTAA